LDKPEPLAGAAVLTQEAPLRILIVVSLPWDLRLGAVRVWAELAEQWMNAGHFVEVFSLTDAYARPTTSRWLGALREARFPHRAGQFVRRNAPRFDVIDCLVGTLPFAKEKLGFNGLLVARSVGFYRSYQQFLRSASERWPNQPRGKFLGRLFYRFTGGLLRKSADEALCHCDLVNFPNEEEIQFLRAAPARDKPVMVQPYGLNHRNRAALAGAILPAEERLKRKEICFVGMWSLRKGARDWAEIIRHIRNAIPEAQFKLLGTMVDEATVFKDFNLSGKDRVRCIPIYEPAELPQLLSSCAVGLFPSYIEGFGIAVLEQLAAGIPTVAYDVPGPRQILGQDRAMLLVPPGDARALADRAIEILQMKVDDYSALSARSQAIANEFHWEIIASETIKQYREALSNLSWRRR
jgi:glycosyltransferase involved in cell wall biosynthesis